MARIAREYPEDFDDRIEQLRDLGDQLRKEGRELGEDRFTNTVEDAADYEVVRAASVERSCRKCGIAMREHAASGQNLCGDGKPHEYPVVS